MGWKQENRDFDFIYERRLFCFA